MEAIVIAYTYYIKNGNGTTTTNDISVTIVAVNWFLSDFCLGGLDGTERSYTISCAWICA